MTEDVPLTELCTICHIQRYKYCCPRCSARTCSLPCIKRHKQWASCSGVRDPATYLKRSELATPRGIDHDYNYLTSIERQLDNAERDAESKGILLHNGKLNGLAPKAHHPAKGEVPLQNAIKQCRVVVDRAPKGMSRQKQNETYWDKRAKRVVWTVEWVHKNGSRELGSCPDTEPLDVAYTRLFDADAAPSIAKAGPNTKPPKKKRKPNKASKTATATPITPPKDLPTGLVTSLSAAAPSEYSMLSTEDVPAPLGADQNAATITQDAEDEKPLLPSPRPEQPPVPQVHFYLLLPSTPTSYRVLISIASNDTLASALRDRFVLEFPTLYALKQPPDNLPKGFMNEEDYLKSIAQKGRIDLDGLLGEARGWGRNDLVTDGKQADVDPRTLQDVLKRDLISVVDAV
ncbi:MAG: hypothetical protein L6R36_000794 [Xanthoria steineri]|nr:MAG: hypothetical protein L6R36_000794 [Xanthoria steineri]